MIRFSDISKIAQGEALQQYADREITHLFVDSRKMILSDSALFFAIAGERHDGHRFIQNLYRAGIRQFVVEREIEDLFQFPEANFFKVLSSVQALQAIVVNHRNKFLIPVIGITGSNGKTIIKEWLYQFLFKEWSVVKNPGSYNSQIGVPLSVWQMEPHHQVGIFEAGISKPGEMELLLKLIQPTIGIITNLGSAHDEGFANEYQKMNEKLKLFNESKTLIFCADHLTLATELSQRRTSGQQCIGWGSNPSADVQVGVKDQRIDIQYNNRQSQFTIPFSDAASIENITHCIVTLLYLKISDQKIQEGINLLKGVPMRLEMKQGINQTQIIDDTYNNDLEGLQISLNFLSSIHKKKKTLILSDIFQSGMSETLLVEKINKILQSSEVNSFIGIGNALHRYQHLMNAPIQKQFFISTQEFIQNANWDQFQQEVILVKGARAFQFEKIVQRLQRKIHGTVMEINLDALVHNLNFFKAKLKPGVKLMVMVKAFAYGSGSEEVAGLLQYHKVDYLGVAYTDEGVELRKNRISLPIMVMNPGEENFEALLDYKLEPEIYGLRLLHALVEFLQGRPCKIHVKIDTGMHRLGFEQQDLQEVIRILKANTNIEVASIFSHLAGADDPTHDEFSRKQANELLSFSKEIKKELGIKPILHLLNSSGILRLSDLQFDMVRLGIGLYGVNPTEERFDQLKPAATLKTIISQIKKIKRGESIGYGRKGKAEKEMKIATIAIGYADGFSRSFSQGRGEVLLHGKKAPVIGNVCMDMTMIDITAIDAKEGDEVVIFGGGLSIREVASKINTIPYEILTNTSERVKRVFYAESI